ncbi:endonuclease/exonuclease/phosphatase family protein [Candidatus Leptofilum sp.]|uniref:endonuclease/exonuclease/phosphatase family protein n=1 Tax=Candidatus Leptofilum sp. TaxID=3241576 RepID=UPI003B5A1EA1
MKRYEESVDKIALFILSQYIGTMEQAQKRYPLRWIIGIGLFLVVMGIFQMNVSKPGKDVIACPVECAETINSSAQEPLRILSLNMLHGYPDFAFLEQRTELLSQEIGRLDADIVLLQEVPWTKEYGQIGQQLAEWGNFNYAYYRANGNHALIGFEEGSVILSHFPLENITFTELHPPAGFFENRIVLHATALSPHGPIDLFVTHLTNGKQTINAAQTEALLTFVQNEATHPSLVVGDFNAPEDSPQIVALADLWQDGYRLAHPEAVGATCCVSDISNALIKPLQTRIDYLFVVPHAESTLTIVEIDRVFVEPFETANGRLWLSDHAGLLATIRIEPQP